MVKDNKKFIVIIDMVSQILVIGCLTCSFIFYDYLSKNNILDNISNVLYILIFLQSIKAYVGIVLWDSIENDNHGLTIGLGVCVVFPLIILLIAYQFDRNLLGNSSPWHPRYDRSVDEAIGIGFFGWLALIIVGFSCWIKYWTKEVIWEYLTKLLKI